MEKIDSLAYKTISVVRQQAEDDSSVIVASEIESLIQEDPLSKADLVEMILSIMNQEASSYLALHESG